MRNLPLRSGLMAVIVLLLVPIAFGQFGNDSGWESIEQQRAKPLVSLRVQAVEPETLIEAAITPDGDPVKLTARGPVRSMVAALGRGLWRWAAYRPYHRAGVCVRCPSGHCGSGIVVAMQPGNRCFILTNAHVVEGVPQGGRVSVSWTEGHKSSGQVLLRTSAAGGDGWDLACVLVDQPPAKFQAVPLASRLPPPGTDVDVVAFGGPQFGSPRFYTAKSIQPRVDFVRLAVDAPSIPGDSGSGMIAGGTLCGINFGSSGGRSEEGPTTESEPIGLHWPASSAAGPDELRTFLDQCGSPWGCGPMVCEPRCGPQIIQRGFPGQNPDELYYPPQGQAPPRGGGQSEMIVDPPPIAVDPPVTAPPVQPAIDPDAIADAVAKRLQAQSPGLQESERKSLVSEIAMQLRGDPTLRGPPGNDGKVDVETIVSRVIAQMKPIELILRDPKGGVVDRETIPYGGKIDLQLYPVRK